METQHDPLLALIGQFNAGWERYVALPDNDAFYAESVGPLLDRLTDDCPAATTQAGAIAALNMAMRDHDATGGDVAFLPVKALVGAALVFIDRKTLCVAS